MMPLSIVADLFHVRQSAVRGESLGGGFTHVYTFECRAPVTEPERFFENKF